MCGPLIGVYRPPEIRRKLGNELSLMNDHNVIVMPIKSRREHGARTKDCEDKWDLIAQIDLPVMAPTHRKIKP